MAFTVSEVDGVDRRGDVRMTEGARSYVVDVVVCDPSSVSAQTTDVANKAVEQRKLVCWCGRVGR